MFQLDCVGLTTDEISQNRHKSGGFVKFSWLGIVHTFSTFVCPYLLPIIDCKSIIATFKFQGFYIAAKVLVFQKPNWYSITYENAKT